MDKRNTEQIIKESGCIEGGTKEACIKVKEALRYAIDGGDKLLMPCNQGKVGEFIEAVKVLVAFANKHPDEHVELYYCENDCARWKMNPCPGERSLSKRATQLCPHYIEEDK